MKDKKFRQLYAQSKNRKVCVLRNGMIKDISIFDVLVGDLLQVQTGDMIEVDGIINVNNGILI